MTVLAADLELEMKEPGGVIAVPMVLSTVIYKGSLVSFVAASGLVHAAADDSGDDFCGIAMEGKTAAASGETLIRVYTEGTFLLNTTSVEAADAGKVLTVSDDNTVTDSGSTNDVQVGKLMHIASSSTGWVKINAIAQTAAT
uniref:DUF2190 family protein n=1 Tax=viral metagenome TaxID=1070528 RepID=A0A6M3JBR9_9ZZZZ